VLRASFPDKGQPFDANRADRFVASFDRYLDQSGITASEMKSLREQDMYDKDAIYDRYGEWESDVQRYGGLKDVNTRDAARDVMNHGYHDESEGGKLFADHPEIAKKWADTDPLSQHTNMVYRGVNLAERRIAFDKTDKETGRLLRNGVIDDHLKEGDKTATADQRLLVRNFIKSYEGTLGKGTMSPAVEATMGVLLTANNIRLLPLSLFSQMIEPAQLAFRKNDLNSAWSALGRGTKDLLRTFPAIDKRVTKDRWEDLAEGLGTVASAAAGGMVSGVHNGIQIRGLAGKVNDLFFKYNFMDQWNRSMHIAATKNGVEFLKDHAAGISDHSERFLTELGLKPQDIKVGADGMLVRDAKVGDRQEEARIRRVDTALVKFVNESMAHPDAGSNALWMNDPRFALFSQMKKFNWAHSRFILNRAGTEWRNGNMHILAPAAMAVGSMATADWLRHALDPTSHGAMTDNMSMYDYAEEKLNRAGMFGRGGLPISMQQSLKMGGTGLEPLLGPSVNLGVDLAHGWKEHDVLGALLGTSPGVHQTPMAD
jgi:hypothetical protein